MNNRPNLQYYSKEPADYLFSIKGPPEPEDRGDGVLEFASWKWTSILIIPKIFWDKNNCIPDWHQSGYLKDQGIELPLDLGEEMESIWSSNHLPYQVKKALTDLGLTWSDEVYQKSHKNSSWFEW